MSCNIIEEKGVGSCVFSHIFLSEKYDCLEHTENWTVLQEGFEKLVWTFSFHSEKWSVLKLTEVDINPS